MYALKIKFRPYLFQEDYFTVTLSQFVYYFMLNEEQSERDMSAYFEFSEESSGLAHT